MTEILVAAQLLACRGTYQHYCPSSLSVSTLKLGSWLSSSQTGLVSPSHPHPKPVKVDSLTSSQKVKWSLEPQWWNCQQILQISFSSSPVVVLAPHPRIQERCPAHFWICWLLSPLDKLHCWLFTSKKKMFAWKTKQKKAALLSQSLHPKSHSFSTSSFPSH